MHILDPSRIYSRIFFNGRKRHGVEKHTMFATGQCFNTWSLFFFRVVLPLFFKTLITTCQDKSKFTFWTETKNTMAQRCQNTGFKSTAYKDEHFFIYSKCMQMQWIATSRLSSVFFTNISKSQPQNGTFTSTYWLAKHHESQDYRVKFQTTSNKWCWN